MRLLSRQHITRTFAATLTAGVGLSAALLGATPAAAADPGTITFNGNCGLLGIGYTSVPAVNGKADTEATSVSTGTKLTIVNNLGSAAVLGVNGQNQTPAVQSGKSVAYQAQSGPVKITLSPECGLNLLGSSKAITVTVTPAASQPTNGSGQTGSGSGTTGTSGSSNGQSGTKSGPTESGSTAQRPPATAPDGGAKTPKLPAIHQPVARGAVPPGAADPNRDSGTSGGDSSSSTAPVGGKVKLADPQPISDAGPTGTTSLLALIAAICLVGVGVAAFRTVFGGRQGGHVSSAAART